MRCLRAILGVTRRERLRNEHIRKALQMKNTITEVVKQKRLRWFGHVTRRPPESFVTNTYREDFSNQRPRGRPPKKWITQVREDTGLPIATAEHRTVVIDVQSPILRERGTKSPEHLRQVSHIEICNILSNLEEQFL